MEVEPITRKDLYRLLLYSFVLLVISLPTIDFRAVVPSDPTTWDAVSTLVLTITAIIIYLQVHETRKSTKYLAYSVAPIAWLFLMSPKTSGSDKHWLFVKNESKYKVFLYYRLTEARLDNEEATPPHDGAWDEASPIHVYPGLMQYPSVIPQLSSDLIKESKEKKKDIRIDIYYALAPDYTSEDAQPRVPETWRFDHVRDIWVGPNGIPDVGFVPMISATRAS
jgi:hypothetical protein